MDKFREWLELRYGQVDLQENNQYLDVLGGCAYADWTCDKPIGSYPKMTVEVAFDKGRIRFITARLRWTKKDRPTSWGSKTIFLDYRKQEVTYDLLIDKINEALS